MNKREKLSGTSIAAAAMQMIDKHGEKGFSMRKLAAELGVDPMAIYHHHANKDALIHAVMQALMEECDIPQATGNWQQDLRNLCSSLRALANRHPGAFRIYETYEKWVPAEHNLHEAFYRTLSEAGFGRKATVQSANLLLMYTEAFAVDEISGWLEPEDRNALIKSLEGGDYDMVNSLVDEITAPDTDADFTFGLNVLLNGLQAQLT